VRRVEKGEEDMGYACAVSRKEKKTTVE